MAKTYLPCVMKSCSVFILRNDIAFVRTSNSGQAGNGTVSSRTR